MKNNVFVVLRSALVGVLSCAVIFPVYAQGVREIGSTTPANSDSTVVMAANAAIHLPIHITEPGNYRLNTNLVGISPNPIFDIASSNVTLDLNGFLRYSPKFGQGPKVDLSCLKRQTWESTEGSSVRH
jgi:hypothetical protein